MATPAAPPALAESPNATPKELLAVAARPMAMPELAALATDDWPPMAMESLPAARAPMAAFPPNAVAPMPEATT
jgi:hypothetical protein